MSQNFDFDLIVLGTGPAGQKAAICAAKLGKKVAAIDRRVSVGGVCLHKGTIPSKTLREAVMHLSGFRQKSLYGRSYTVKEEITMADLMFRVSRVISHESEVITHQMRRNGIQLLHGQAAFVDPHSIVVHEEMETRILSADFIMIATGTTPLRPTTIPFDGEHIIDSDEILRIKKIPRSLIVVGGGVIGLEYANMFAALGVDVTLIDGRRDLLEFVDREIIDTLQFLMRGMGVTFRLGENVESVTRDEKGRVAAKLESGKKVLAETLLFCGGRAAASAELNLELVGVKTDNRGRVLRTDEFCTNVPHVFAAGDVVGFPALASTSMEQGRIASLHMFGKAGNLKPRTLPYGIYTIPEISMIGATEEDLTKSKVNYEVGQARYREIAKGQIVNDDQGMLKILFHRETLKILGVHSIGEASTEIIHVGLAVMDLGGTLEYFRDTVFNYPTMAECYKVAALDGLNKLD